MPKLTIVRIWQLLAFAPVVPALIYAASTGADAGYSGAPGEQNCNKCHTSSNGFGRVAITFPNGAFYTPGQAQNLTVTVSDTSKQQWGFQLTARLASSSTTQAGSFTPFGDGYTQVVCDDSGLTTKNQVFGQNPCSSKIPLQWIEQTSLGTYRGQQRSGSWQFTWMPPSSDVGPIIMYVAAVASDGAQGDNVYTANYTLTIPSNTQPAVSSAVDAAGLQGTVSPGAYMTVYGNNLSNSTRGVGAGDIVPANRPFLKTNACEFVARHIPSKSAAPCTSVIPL